MARCSYLLMVELTGVNITLHCNYGFEVFVLLIYRKL